MLASKRPSTPVTKLGLEATSFPSIRDPPDVGTTPAPRWPDSAPTSMSAALRPFPAADLPSPLAPVSLGHGRQPPDHARGHSPASPTPAPATSAAPGSAASCPAPDLTSSGTPRTWATFIPAGRTRPHLDRACRRPRRSCSWAGPAGAPWGPKLRPHRRRIPPCRKDSTPRPGWPDAIRLPNPPIASREPPGWQGTDRLTSAETSTKNHDGRRPLPPGAVIGAFEPAEPPKLTPRRATTGLRRALEKGAAGARHGAAWAGPGAARLGGHGCRGGRGPRRGAWVPGRGILKAEVGAQSWPGANPRPAAPRAPSESGETPGTSGGGSTLGDPETRNPGHPGGFRAPTVQRSEQRLLGGHPIATRETDRGMSST